MNWIYFNSVCVDMIKQFLTWLNLNLYIKIKLKYKTRKPSLEK